VGVDDQVAQWPEAWAVWRAWQGSSAKVAVIARHVSEQLGSAKVVAEIDRDADYHRMERENIAAELPEQSRRPFDRLLVSGAAHDRTVEVDFDNERVKTGGRGVVLRVTATTEERATEIRDALVTVISTDGNPFGGDAIKGMAASASADEALHKAERDYRTTVALAGAGVVVAVFIAFGFLHDRIDPSSAVGRVVLFCLCSNKVVGFLIYVAAVGAAAFVLAPRLFPQIEISERSVWSRVQGKVLGLVASSVGAGAVLEWIAQRLPG
jgi:hypothetical protein